MLKRFFKDMPKDLNKTDIWKMEVFALFPLKDSVVYSKTYTGKLWVAYLIIRLRALLKDWSTDGSYYGIAWGIQGTEMNGEGINRYGYK